MDYERTKKYYDDMKQANPNTTIKYIPLGDEIEYHKWEKRCKDADGNWHQDPKHPEIKYPLKATQSIYRVMTREGEKLKSSQRWTGLNAYLDPQHIDRIEPETYIETLFTKRRIQDPNNRDNIITEPAAVGTQTTKYEIDFTPENLDSLYNMRDEGFCNLALLDKRRDVPPREVLSYDDFRNKAFDELIAMQTPGAKIANDQHKPATARR